MTFRRQERDGRFVVHPYRVGEVPSALGRLGDGDPYIAQIAKTPVRRFRI